MTSNITDNTGGRS